MGYSAMLLLNLRANKKENIMKKSMRFLLASLLLTMVSGCFEANQTIVINDDQTASYQVDLVVSSALLAMAKMASEGAETSLETCDNEMLNTDVPERMSVEKKSYYKDDDLVCSFKISGSLSDFAELKMSGSMGKSGSDFDFIAIESLPDNQIKISSIFDFTEESSPADEAQNPFADSMDGMFTAMLSNRAFRWSVTAPKIIETNGQISADGKSVNWELPLSVAYSEKAKYEFYSIVEYNIPWYQELLNFLVLSLATQPPLEAV